jgi:dihydroneopterin aldolase
MTDNEQFATISLQGLRFYGYHGVYANEQQDGGQFEVDVQLWADIATAAATDDLGQTVDYAAVYQCVAQFFAPDYRVRLLETLVVRLGEAVLAQFASVARVDIRVSKLAPQLAGPCERTSLQYAAMRDM